MAPEAAAMAFVLLGSRYKEEKKKTFRILILRKYVKSSGGLLTTNASKERWKRGEEGEEERQL